MKSAAGPLAQLAERGADTPGSQIQRLRRGREFEPLTDQIFFPLFSFHLFISCFWEDMLFSSAFSPRFNRIFNKIKLIS